MKLWNKDIGKLDKKIEKFTVGNDYLLDQNLVEFDCIASKAHAKMLNKIGILDDKELNQLLEGLDEIIKLHKKSKFVINIEDEDCHTAIELFLTEKYGGVGKKIHTARSRNDQVLTAMRLYEKEQLCTIKKYVKILKEAIIKKADKNSDIIIPGYTHMQKAMPLSIKEWLGSFACALENDLMELESAMKLVDKSPLGSAAGFGTPGICVDKDMTAKEIGFAGVIGNNLYCQFSRGKVEASLLNLLSQLMLTLNKLSTDLIMFNMSEFGYVKLPKEFCTGSSIMPQKQNPDVLELIRAKYHVVLGEEMKVKSMISNLMSGYNRDIQLTKKPVMESFELVIESMDIMSLVISGIEFNKEKCKLALTPELYATEKAYKLVKEGMPFRDAYKKVGKEILQKKEK